MELSSGPSSHQPHESLSNFTNLLEPLLISKMENHGYSMGADSNCETHRKGPADIRPTDRSWVWVVLVSDSDCLYTGLMGTSTVEQLLENVCLLLASRTRDVVKSALGFIKVAVVVMDVVHLAKHVQLVVRPHFLHWAMGASEVPMWAPWNSGQTSLELFHCLLFL